MDWEPCSCGCAARIHADDAAVEADRLLEPLAATSGKRYFVPHHWMRLISLMADPGIAWRYIDGPRPLKELVGDA